MSSSTKQTSVVGEKEKLIIDNTIDDVEFIVAKPLLSRLDVFPFIALYSISIGLYLNLEEEWQTIFAMIGILLVFVAHLIVLLLGYWHINIRVKLAYNVLNTQQVLDRYSKFNSNVFNEGIRYAQSVYEGKLTRYKMWYTVWLKKAEALKTSWKAAKAHYERNPTTAVPPPPFDAGEPPKPPVVEAPVVLYGAEGDVLEVVVRPAKHHGNPTICQCVFDVGDNRRIAYKINGLITPKEIVEGTAAVHNKVSKIELSGPRFYPPIKFSFHHMQYIIDPNKPQQQDDDGDGDDHIPVDKFVPRKYPDDCLLSDYLTHSLTPTTTPSLSNSTTLVNTGGKVTNVNNKKKTTKKKKDETSSSEEESDSDDDDEQDNKKTATTTTKGQASLILSFKDATFKSLQYGLNSLTVPIPSFISIFIENAMSPFFVFQVVCILLWMLDEYWYYSLFTLFMIVALECTVVYKRQSHLNQMLGEKPPLPHVYVYRTYDQQNKDKNNNNNAKVNGEWIFTPSKCLVPGDIVALPVYNEREQITTLFGPKNDIDESTKIINQRVNPNNIHYKEFRSGRPQLYTTEIPCDLLLLSGSCVCDESMLTGESVPQIKEDLISLNTYSSDESTAENTTTPTNDDDLSLPLNNNTHKRHILYSGTKLIGIQRSYDYSALSTTTTTTENDNDNEKIFNLLTSRPPLPNNVDIILTRVLRTGFSTIQGSLVRTILTATDQVLIDKEALYFILALLCCAIISAYHVLIEGLADQSRSRYKLLLNVITILTSVVPPELPMQLSMAVNNALAMLAKTKVFCTEPNRIPLAGELNICCFDKTGTLCADTFLLTCAVTYKQQKQGDDENNNNNNIKQKKDNYIVMRADIKNEDLREDIAEEMMKKTMAQQHRSSSNSDDSDEDEDEEEEEQEQDENLKSIKSHTLPIDMRLIMGCANELTMLQMPAKKNNAKTDADGKKKKDNTPQQRIIGDPMESVAFTQAGFHFFNNNNNKKKEQNDDGNSNSNNNTNNKMWCDATPVVFNNKTYNYETSKTTTSSKGNNNNNTRIEAQVLHRFTFQSQLQRMSTIVHLESPQQQANLTTSTTIANDNNVEWLNSTLPNTELQSLASKTMLRCVVKGSPEAIYDLLHPDYRPSFEQYTSQHKYLARQGLRVLALAWKPLFIDTTNNTTANNNNHVLCDIDNFQNQNNNKNIKGSLEYQQKYVSNKTQNTWLNNLKVQSRDISEKNLFFGGIIGFNSPLKTQSKEVIEHLQYSLHKTICITGDHLLTAIAVAKSLNIAKQNCLLLSTKQKQQNLINIDNNNNKKTKDEKEKEQEEEPKFIWINEYEEYVKDCDPKDPMLYDLYKQNSTPSSSSKQQQSEYNNTSLCINGDIFKLLCQYYKDKEDQHDVLPLLCSITSVFARTLPYQKEMVLKFIKEYKNQKVSFVGDGTNDIGGLSHATIGIALLPIDTDSVEQLTAAEEKAKEMSKFPPVAKLLENAQKLREKGFTAQAETIEQNAHSMFKRFKAAQDSVGGLLNVDGEEDDDNDGSVKLGDASLAAAFSAKHGSIRCVLDVIRQGRCALATTGQMYQILALQCLVAAYSLSALYFQGVRQSESQMTVGGLVGAATSMLMAQASPLEKVSQRKPNSKIFSFYNITTIVLQFIIHLSILMYMVAEAMKYTTAESLIKGQDETITTYIPSVLNTVVFVLSTAMGATTILANYVGYPFMTPLTWTPLFKVIIGTIVGCVALSTEFMPEINEMLEMSPMPTEEFGTLLASMVLLDCVACVIVSLVTKVVFGIVTIDDLIKPLPKDCIAHSVKPVTAAAAKKTNNNDDKNKTTTKSTIKKK